MDFFPKFLPHLLFCFKMSELFIPYKKFCSNVNFFIQLILAQIKFT